MSTHGSRHQPHPGETGSGLALGAVSSQHSSAQAGGAQTVLGAQSPWRRSVCAPEGGREHKGPRPPPPALLRTQHRAWGPSWEGAVWPRPGRAWGPCQLQPALGTTRRFVPRRFSESRGRGEWENHTEGLQDPSAPRRSLICNRDRPPYREQTEMCFIPSTKQSSLSDSSKVFPIRT